MVRMYIGFKHEYHREINEYLTNLSPGFATRVTRQVSHMEQELLTLPENLSSYAVLVGFALLGR